MAGLSRPFCDKLLFAIPESVPIEIIPDDAGLILADAYGAEILRKASEHRMGSASRRAVLVVRCPCGIACIDVFHVEVEVIDM